ncbi:MAG: energy transducer TonB [Acidobacteria bacterium]|nr:energy transducer TonB [Acidobacteriota bacterium]
MRSKMLGLAVALTTFGLGVTATTAWIAYHTPDTLVARNELMKTRTEAVNLPLATFGVKDAPCDTSKSRTTARGESVIINGGVLNGRGLPGESPAPTYPAIARTAQVSGTVVVQVLADECGKVISARPLSGHPLLQQAAVQAAYGWHFAPGLLGGEPVKVRGTLTFNFLLQ